VKEEDNTTILGGIEQSAQVFFGFPDIFADDRGEIDAVEIEAKVISEHLGGHRLAGATLPGKERADAETSAHLFAKSPSIVHFAALPHLVSDLVQQAGFGCGKHDVLPACLRLNALGQILHFRTAGSQARAPKPIVEGALITRRFSKHAVGNTLYASNIELKLT